MAKKGRDLFELLEQRQRGDSPRKPRAKGAGLAEPVARLGSRLLNLLPGRPPSLEILSRRDSKSPRGGGISATLAALMVVAAAAGGYWWGSAGSGVEASTGNPGPQAQMPGVLPGLDPRERAAGPLEIRNDADGPSDFFFAVLTYAADERERAKSLASYLNDYGLEFARIKLLDTRSGPRWATLVYVPTPADAAVVRGKLKAVPPPDFEPDFAERIGKDIALLSHKSE